MKTSDTADRFARTELLLGSEAMKRLIGARVLVAGLGAVGSYAMEALARAGVGHLTLVDFDVIRPSNINRQLFALESTLNKPKIDIARARALDINPSCSVEAENVFIDEQTAGPLVSRGFDAIIDAIDSVNPKVELLATAARAGSFVISSMGAACRLDPAAIRVGDISETEICPLARFIRKKLKKRGVERGILCVYSTEPVPPSDQPPPSEDAAEHNTFRRGRVRRPIGSLSSLPGIFGLIAAHHAVMHIVGPRKTEET